MVVVVVVVVVVAVPDLDPRPDDVTTRATTEWSALDRRCSDGVMPR